MVLKDTEHTAFIYVKNIMDYVYSKLLLMEVLLAPTEMEVKVTAAVLIAM